MSVTHFDEEDHRVIRVSGQFTFAVHQAFRNAYADCDPAKTRFVIDLSRTDYMDSSALGMLLVLREKAGADKSRVTLRGSNETVGQVLEVSRFDNLFTLETK